MTESRLPRTIHHLCWLIAYSSALLLLIGCSNASAGQPGPTAVATPPAPTRTIVWGKVDSEPTDAILKWQPLVDYLAANLSDGNSVWSGEVKIAPDMETMSRWMASGEVDLVVDSLYPAMIVAEASDAVPLALRNTGKPDKRAVFFARSDSGLTSLQDLEGRLIGLPERHSTSGFMLPVAHLKKSGMNPTEKADNDPRVGSDEVGYLFTGDDRVAAQWVLDGTVIAAATDDNTFEEFSAGNPGVLVNLGETENHSSSSMVLVRKDMDPVHRETILAVLLGMDQSDEGQAALEFARAVSFDEVRGDTEIAWNRTQELYHLISD